MIERYDIFYIVGKDLRWVEAAVSLDAAKARIYILASVKAGEYIVYDQKTERVVWKSLGLISES
jgi:hypothetical protein